MEYKKITQKEYLNQLQTTHKSLFIANFQEQNNLNKCFSDMEKLLNDIDESDLNKCYNSQKPLKLISGLKKRLVFSLGDDLIYGNLKGEYLTFKFKGFEFIANTYKEDETTILNLSFMEV